MAVTEIAREGSDMQGIHCNKTVWRKLKFLSSSNNFINWKDQRINYSQQRLEILLDYQSCYLDYRNYINCLFWCMQKKPVHKTNRLQEAEMKFYEVSKNGTKKEI
jgi:hypothetical protein